MLRIRSWERWQRPFIYEVTRRRKDKGAPVTMRYVALAADLDDEPSDGEDEGNWRRFARLVGPRQAETMLVRVLQYVATKAALTGQIRVSRESFGAVVLSRDLDVVSRADGERVYDALVLSAIAEDPAGQMSGDASGEMTGHVSGQLPGHSSGPLPGQSPGEPSGDLPGSLPPLAGAPPRARSVSVSVDGSPPLPSPAGEGGGQSAPPPEDQAQPGEPLTVGERAAACVVAEAIERGDVRLDPDDEQRVLVGAKEHRVPLRVACNAARDAARADARDRRRDARDRGGAA
ncbi:MAG: hypothetical protein K8T90_08745 [Planctomycetes bacterium]|nr:hypothetical protein [Planctomycetota bacterium]